MHRSAQGERIAIIGFGAIGRRVYASLRASPPGPCALSVLVRRDARALRESIVAECVHENLGQLLSWAPTLAVECATQEAAAEVLPAVLASGADVIVASVGALADAQLRLAVEAASRTGRSRVVIVAGGIGGLDALNAASVGGLDTVAYVGRKPPRAWIGTPAERALTLSSISRPTTIFSGNAAEAARQYPKNANVTAAIALSGIGFERTAVELVADPGITRNVHQVEAAGAFGSLSLVIENNPLPDNPKTSMLAALSIEAKVRSWFGHLTL